eukprot:c14093_g1_i1 orf=419-802(+)
MRRARGVISPESMVAYVFIIERRAHQSSCRRITLLSVDFAATAAAATVSITCCIARRAICFWAQVDCDRNNKEKEKKGGFHLFSLCVRADTQTHTQTRSTQGSSSLSLGRVGLCFLDRAQFSVKLYI